MHVQDVLRHTYRRSQLAHSLLPLHTKDSRMRRISSGPCFQVAFWVIQLRSVPKNRDGLFSVDIFPHELHLRAQTGVYTNCASLNENIRSSEVAWTSINRSIARTNLRREFLAWTYLLNLLRMCAGFETF